MKTKCRHFNGPIHNDCCKAGVNYRKLGDDSKPGYLARLPCVVGSPLTKEPVTCDKIDLFTEKELEQIEQEITINSNFMIKIVAEIRKSKSNFGEVICPKCNATFNFSVAKSNGHIWGKCSTKGCISFIS